MKRDFYIVILLLCSLAFSCKGDDDTVNDKQKDSILKYLENSRRLIPEERRDSVIENNPKFYSYFGNRAYFHIPTFYDEGRESRREIFAGNLLRLRFTAYVFTSSEPDISSVYFSNDSLVIKKLQNAVKLSPVSLNWGTEPLELVAGVGDIIPGVDQALLKCRDKDSLQVYMSFNMAYGKNIIGVVPKRSAVAWYIKILDVYE
ncbi:MAG: FKBP-type peptidyl-prolyl cis-trans isomerase [Alistipes sp.]|nr:FKBP-type peptidyl-prolyl cis-trans isomerase [Candidatus Alistipes equi]